MPALMFAAARFCCLLPTTPATAPYVPGLPFAPVMPPPYAVLIKLICFFFPLILIGIVFPLGA